MIKTIRNKALVALATAVMLLIIFSTGDAIASPIRFNFNGEITNVWINTSDPFNGAIEVGTPFWGTYTFDPETPNSGSEYHARYIHTSEPYGIELTVGFYTGTSKHSDISLYYRIVIDQGHVQDIQTPNMPFGGYTAGLVQLFLKDVTSTALQNTDLSATPPDLNDYTFHELWFNIVEPDGSAMVTFGGIINEITPIPEPATMFLLASGLVGLAAMKRKFRRA